MKYSRPTTTLFMLISVDGKISTGSGNVRDVDKDFPLISGVKDGLHQYYELEQKTDLYSLNTGKVQAKIGVNKKRDNIEKSPVNFIVIDNKPHLDDVGVDYFIKKSNKFFLVTTNKNHPVYKRRNENNLEIVEFENEINFHNLFGLFTSAHNIDAITIQSGGELNSVLLREGLIDKLSLVVAPCLIGGDKTPSLITGKSLSTIEDLNLVQPLKFVSCDVLKNSYIHLVYDVINN